MNQRNVPISLPCTDEEEYKALRLPIMDGWMTQGPRVAAFEKAFAKRHELEYALAVSSCTTGLHLILAAMNIGPGDEVIVPSFTWIASANAVLYCGATPILADVSPLTFTIDPENVIKLITPQTKALIAVHLFGLCADIDGLKNILPKHVAIIEDAACAAGAAYKGQPAGNLGRAAAFSFHPRKTITTGEGGMVTTNDSQLADTMNQLRNHGATLSEDQRHLGPKPYMLPDFNLLGFNYRMTDLQGAVGKIQLGKLDNFIQERKKWANYYVEQLEGIEWIQTPTVPEYATHSWQAFVVYVNPQKAPLPRNQIMEHLQQAGVSTRPGTHAIHTLNYYQKRFGCKPEDCPASRDCQANTMAIPLHNCMTTEDYEYVVNTLKGIK
jgi:perosamine synthetase